MALILVLVALTDGLVGQFARKPIPWIGIIPGLIPILIAFFVIIPILKTEKTEAPGA